MIPTGMIFATLDVDLDAIEAWNRWYDLEHTPPNLWLPGVMLSRRYVAPPELHEIREVAPDHGMANQHVSFVTIYTLCEDPIQTVTGMSTLRDKLYAQERMNFPPDKKIVRPAGGAMTFISGVSSPDIRLPSDEIPFVGHTAMLSIHRRSTPDVAEWYRTEWAQKVVTLDGVYGVGSFKHMAEGEELDLVYFEGDPVAQTKAIRATAPHHPDAAVLADAPFLLINYLDYPWADRMRASSLPQTING
ncbi:MAG: hypothetical protein AB7L13_14685 [Acidimicrobiia bacterium]